MRKTPSKKQAILEICRERGFSQISADEIRTIREELRRRLHLSPKTSDSYIASVLREAGMRVEVEDRYADPLMGEPYASRLKGLLEFYDLESAEASLAKLDAVYREYGAQSDQVGTGLVRKLVLKGKLRAASLAGNPRVSPAKRQEKQEIARWFTIWLDVPDLFFDWLELRKGSEEFQRLFPSSSSPEGKAHLAE